MKVLMVHDQSAIIGGAEVQVQREIEGLRDLGHDVRLVAGGCGQGTAASLAPDYGFRTGGSFVWRNLRMVHNPGAPQVLRRAMSEFQPDVVHCHTLTMASPATLRNAARCRLCRHSPRLLGHVPAPTAYLQRVSNLWNRGLRLLSAPRGRPISLRTSEDHLGPANPTQVRCHYRPEYSPCRGSIRTGSGADRGG